MRLALPAVLISLFYFLPAVAASQWALVTRTPPALWPAAGVAVAGLAISGLRYWPAVFVAMFAVLQVNDSTHDFGEQLLLAASKSVAAVAGALILRRASSRTWAGLRQVQDVGWLFAAAAVAALVSVTTGAAVFWWEGHFVANSLPNFLVTWCLGDALGILTFGSLLLAWQRIGEEGWGRRQWINLAVTLAVTALVTWLVYFGAPRSGAFYLYPVLVWAAFNLRTAGATATLALMSLVAVAGTSIGLGPFARANTVNIVTLQQYLMVASLMTLLLSAVLEERRTQALNQTQRAEAAASDRLAELTSLYESAPIGLAFFSRDYRYLRINSELAEINGVPADRHLGRTIRDVLPGNAPAVEPVIDQVFATGVAVRDLEVTGETPRRPGVVRHWLTGFYPILDEAGDVQAVGIWVVEISERKAAEERERLLAREVDHRAKNLLAVVQSVVQLTQASEPAELKAGIVGRIQALARAHSLLADARWDGAELDNLVREELAPYLTRRDQRAEISGDAFFLRPAAAQSIAMVFHELATNAAKYGALSTAEGRVHVRWQRHGEGNLEILWHETGGSPAAEPATIGFGSKIIRASIERQLKGTVEYDWRREGLRCRISIPAAEAMTASGA